VTSGGRFYRVWFPSPRRPRTLFSSTMSVLSAEMTASGGFGDAIVNTFVIVVFATVLSVPFGILGVIHEVCRQAI